MRQGASLLLALTLSALLCACTAFAPAPEPRLLVLPVLHGLHAKNPHYTYDDVYRIVGAFDPDAVAVEIRAEDLGAAEDYLAANYPLEMRELARAYSGKTIGIDWLGREVAGGPIPPDWWRKGSPQKALERDLAAEGPDLSGLEALQERQMEIARDAGPVELADGSYAAASRAYYAAMAQALANTKWAPLPAFYAGRDARIAANAVAAATARPNARIVFVVGADHFGPVRQALIRRFGETALAPVRDPTGR